MADTFTVTQVTNLSGLGDVDGDGVIDPGEIVTTTVTITNNSTTTDATGVSFAEVLQGMTQVNQGNDADATNDINVSPLAFDDSYNSVGNATLTVSQANGVLGGAVANVHETFAADTEFLSQSIGTGANQTHVVAGTFATAHGGSVIIAADGSFTYTPAAGFAGTGVNADSFTYTLRDAGLDGTGGNADDLTGTGTVSIDVGPVVWFIDNSAATNGNGTQASPFNSIANFNAVNNGGVGHPQTGDTVYLATGTGPYSGADGINLLNGQTLIGAGEALTITPTGGGNPVTIFAAGTAPVIEVTGTGEGVSLAQDNILKGFAISTTVAGADGIEDGNGTVGNLTISNISISGTGQAVDIDQGGNLNVTITSLSSSGSSEQAVQLAATGTALTGSFTANGGTIAGSTLAAFQVGDGAGGANTGGTVAISYSGSIAATGAVHTVDIQDRAATAGTITLSGSLSHSGDGTAIVVDDSAAGIINFSGTSKVLNSGTATAVDLSDNGTATINFTGGGLDIDTSSGTGFSATNGGTVTIQGSGNSINSTGATAINLSTVTVGASGVTLASTDSGGGARGVNLDTVTGTGSISLGTGTLSGHTAAEIDINAGSGNVTYTGTIGNGSGLSAEISNHTSGTISITGNINDSNDAGGGISIFGNSGGTIDFTGSTKTLNTGAGNAVDLANNSGTTVNFTGGGLDIDTTSGTGFEATGAGPLASSGGTVNVTGSGNTINSGTGTALNIVNTTIGASDLTFQSISANGGSAGIALNNTGALGGLTVTGTGTTDGSGGTIQNISARGISVVDARDVTLSNMTLNNANTTDGATSDGTFGGNENTDENGAIHLVNATNISLTNIDINGTAQHGIVGNTVTNLDISNSTIQNTGNEVWESGIYIFNLLGTSNAGTGNSISGTTISHTGQFNLFVQNDFATNAAGGNTTYSAVNRGAMDLLTLSNDTFQDSGVNLFGDNVTIVANSASNMRTVVTNSTFTGTVGGSFGTSDNIQVDASGTGHSDFDISGSTFTGGGQTAINVSAAGTGFATFDIHDNTNINTRTGPAINVAINGDSEVRGHIQDNPLIYTTVANSASSGVNVVVDQTGLAVVDIDNNAFVADPGNATHLFGNAVIRGGARNGVGGQADLTIQNNTVTGAKFEGLELFSGNGSVGESSTVRVHFANNNINGGAGFDDYLLDQYTGDSFQIQGFGGTGTNQAQVEAFVAATDPGSTVNAFGGLIVNYSNGTPSLPLLAAGGGVEAVATDPDNTSPADVTPPLDVTPPTDVTPPASDTPPVDTAPPGEEAPPPSTGGETPIAPAHPVIVNDGVLSQSELDYFVDAAITRWAGAGLSAEQLAALHDMHFTVANMSGLYLGSYSPDAITVDADAAGWGWFLDGTPLEDSEFGNQLAATRMTTDPTGAPAGHYDLMTALMHEMGHALGLGDSYNAADAADLMYGWLQLGERRLAAAGEAGAAVTGSIQGEEFLGSPVNIGVLPAGKSVTVQWQATINPQTNQQIVNPSNQGSVTSSNFPTTPTDGDTGTAGAQPTITTLDTLTLGGTIWNDNGAGGGVAIDGHQNGGEAGVNGVLLTLFADTGSVVGAWDAGDTFITTTTTSGGGNYSFTGLAPGEYIVRVDQDNFDAGGNTSLLATQNSSPGNPDPDDNVDNDDNGSRVLGSDAYSQAITLAYNTEPTAGTGNDTNNTLDFGFYPNSPPTISNLAGDSATFTEDGAPLILDDSSAPEVAASVADSDSADFNTGNLTVSIAAGGVPAEDALSIVVGNQITVAGNVVSYNGNAIGTFTGGTGGASLVVTFNSVDATTAAVSALVGQIAYQNTNTTTPNSGDRTVNFTVNDGDGGTSTVSAVTLHITAVNDEPTLVATAVNPTFTEGGAAADIFTTPIVGSTVEPGQTFASMTLTVTNVTDGASEILNFDGTNVALTNGNSVGPTATNGLTVTVGVIGTTATVTFGGAVLTAGQLQTLVNALSYSNTSQDPTDANRVVTITQLVDSGSNVAPNDNTTALSIVSTVNVDPVNDEPTLTATAVNPTFAEGGGVADIFSGVTASTVEAGQSFTSMTLTVTNVTDIGSEILTLDGSDVTLSNGFSVTTGTNGLLVTVSFVGNTASVTFGGSLSGAELQTLVDGLSYRNTSDNPTDANRVVTITQLVDSGPNAPPNDDTATLAVTSTVNVDPTNDAPDATITPLSYLGQPGVAIDLKNNGLAVADIDGNAGSETVTLSVTSGTLNVTAGGSGAGISGNNTSSVTITGTVAQINALLNTDPTSTVSFIDSTGGSKTLTLLIHDNGNTGGGDLSANDTAQIVLDEPPVLANAGDTAPYTEQQSPAQLETNISISDPDGPVVGDQINGATVTIISFLSGDQLNFSDQNGISGSYVGGVLTLSGPATIAEYEAALRSITFSSTSDNPTNFDGDTSRTISWTVRDDLDVESSPVTSTVTITAANDAPQATIAAVAYSATEQTSLDLKNTGLSVADVDGGGPGQIETATLSVVDGVLNAVAGNSGATVLGTGSSSLTITGTIAQINAFLDATSTSTLSYFNSSDTPPASTVLTLAIDDGGNTGGGAVIASDTTTINIASVNDAPSGADNTVTATEDTAYVFSAADFGFTDALDNNALLAVKITTLASTGQLFDNNVAINPGDFVTAAHIDGGLLTFVPATNLFGSASSTFTFQVQDDGGTLNSGVDLDQSANTITIDVNPIADTPSVTNATVDEDGQTTSGLVISRNAADSAEVAFFKITNIQHGTLYLNDGSTQVNNGDFVAFADANLGLKFSPTADYNGSASFDAQASLTNGNAGLGGGVVTATITVNPVNDEPSFVKGSDQIVTEDAGAQTVSGWATAISAGPADEFGQALTFNVSNNNNALFSVQPTVNAAGELTYTLAANAFGAASVDVFLQDNGGAPGDDTSPTQTFNITVNPIADTPSVTNATVDEDGQTTSGLVISRNAADSAEVAFFKITNIQHGTLYLNDGSTQVNNGDFVAFADANLGLKFSPTADYNGSASFDAQASLTNGNAGLGGGVVTATITVNPVNDEPSFVKGSDQIVTEDAGAQTVTGWATAISAGPADESGQALTFNVSNNNNALFSVQPTVNAAGELTYTLAANAFGAASVDVFLQDNGAAPGDDTSPTQTFNITVNPVADTPSVTNATVDEDGQTTSGLVISRNAADSAEVAFFKITNIQHGTLYLNDGSTQVNNGDFVAFADANLGLKFSPTADYNGSASFDAQASLTNGNAGLGGGVVTATITVNPVNDEPSFVKGSDQIVTEDAGAQTVTGWATAISAGPADESGQALTFSVSNNNNALFSVQPTVNAAGELTYTLAANAFGAASVDVFLQDNGGAPGDDTSPTQTFNITVNPVADTPSVTNATVNEDGQTTSGLVISRNAADSAEVAFFKITNIQHGTLYLNDGSTQVNNGDFVAFADANLGLKFSPTADYNGSASFDAQASLTNGNAGLGGGVVTATITVNPVNDAPLLDASKTPVLTPEIENSGAPVGAVGTLVTALVDFTGGGGLNNVGDVDSGAVLGIAVTAADTAHGAWFYSTNGGSNWLALGAVANNSARLLAADANTRLYFQPTAGFNGPVAPAITFHAWDQTSGSNGNLGDTTSNGGTTAFSVQTDTANLTITPINHEPSGTSSTITAFEDTARVLTAADFGFTDTVDGNTLAAVKITALPGAGTLKNNGVAVTAGQTISIADINAGHLSFQAALNANGAAYAQFSFQVQDNGGTLNGGVDLDQTPNTLTVDVNAVNDAPSAVILSNVHGPFPENTPTALPIKIANIAVTDVDGGTNILSLSGADANLFRLIGSTLWLKAGAHLDFETNPFLNVNVNVNDPTVGGPVDATKALAIAVTDIAENIIGTPHNDRLIGTRNGETIIGLAGNDIIYGNAGNDRIIGGPGADYMIGGPGKDVFVFNSIQDSAPGQSGYINNNNFNWASGVGRRDIIADFTHGQDKIDLSAIDANNHAGGNQAFTWIGLGNFHNHHPGELGYRQYNFSGTAHDKTIIYGDINGDARADFQIELTGLKALVPSDFIL